MRDFLVACSSILFLKSAVAGALVVAVTLLVPSVALLGAWAYLCGELAMASFRVPESDPVRPILRYNALLIGFAMGHLFALSLDFPRFAGHLTP